ncbi:MAG: hypothetical protein EOP32_11950 [Rhodococcus sp. (in: high G+C Gram-positive bacteria)]|nr:MAG: hypothetical protein EOP32_11950 [Rhodococcus sp. (in: high G+C Gram-positive bacteria)]
MTSPGGASGITPPNGAVTGDDGSTTAMAQQTQDAVIAQKSAALKASDSWGGASNTFFGGILSGFANLLGVIDGIADAFDGTSDGGGPTGLLRIFDHQEAQQQSTIDLQNKVEDLLTGGTRSTFMVSGTWTNPGPGRMVGVACVQGGQGGVGVVSTTRSIGGRYIYSEFRSDDLPSTVAVTVGSGGVGVEGDVTHPAGGTSSFGSYLVSNGSGSGILTSQGILTTAGNAGDGGLGKDSADARTTAQMSGTGNALATGGAYTGSNPGTAGGNSPTSQIAVAGGGGGAGGPEVGASTTSQGGVGGWPGGAGGNGGTVGFLGDSVGGNGGVGAVFVTVIG